MSRHHRNAGWGGKAVTALRNHAKREIASAEAIGEPIPCGSCGQPVLPGQPFDIGHVDGVAVDKAKVRIEHQHCNRADGAAVTNALRRSRIMRTRRWS